MASDNNRENLMRLAYFFLESSSDSSDEEDMLLLFQGNNFKRQKIAEFIGNDVDLYSDEEFRRNFGFKRDVCSVLISRFEESIYFPKNINHGGRKAISAETHILSFLWFTANKSCMRDVAGCFGMAESSFYRALQRVLEFFVEIAPTVIMFPGNTEEKEKTEEYFRDVADFPGVLGCISERYITIRTPAHMVKSTLANKHDMTYITLQGICDAQGKFLNVFTGMPSNIHDSLRSSFIEKELPRLCGDGYYVIGDAAYPLREWLLKPFQDNGQLTDKQNSFNNKFCATRVIIENTFSSLKQRFKQLTRIDFHGVDQISKLIMACCVLHNLCIDNDDVWKVEDSDDDDSFRSSVSESDEEGVFEESNLNQSAGELLGLGELKRNQICDSLNIDDII